ncbi:hypothetical protein GCM10027091_69980 [Streptomyces daliensis]
MRKAHAPAGGADALGWKQSVRKGAYGAQRRLNVVNDPIRLRLGNSHAVR